MKILILGSNGFIGSSLKKYFLCKPDLYEVLFPKRDELNLLNYFCCEDYLKKNKPDIIINCAVEEKNIENTLRIFFNTLSFKDYFGKMIYLGSGAEYNPKKYLPLMKEDYSKTDWPTFGYPFSKWLIGDYIEKQNSQKVINLRLFGVYGNFENFRRRFISNNICRSICGLNLSLNKDMKLDYLHIDDFIKILEIIISRNIFNHNTYNICSGKPKFLSEIGMCLQKTMKIKDEIRILEPGLKLEYSGNPSRAINEFGEFFSRDFDKTIPEMIIFFQKMFKNDKKLKENFLILEK